jgi:predicted ribosome quality control (RQC) complex YloA/Tae2 family protein
MNNYYTLIYLIREWNRKLINTVFSEAISARKNTLELYFNDDSNSYRITFSSDPQRTALFMDRFQAPRRGNVADFFSSLQGRTIKSINLADKDRIVTFLFDDDQKLTFLLFGGKANALLSSNGRITEAFKREDAWIDKPLPEASPAVGNVPSEGKDPFRVATQIAPLLPRGVLKIWSNFHLKGENIGGIATKVQELSQSLHQQSHPHFDKGYGFSILDPVLLYSTDPKTFDSVNDGVAYAFYNEVRETDFISRKTQIRKKLEQVAKKLDSALAELDNIGRAVDKSTEFEQIGHLLMAQQHLKPENDSVEISDFYADGAVRKISVIPDLSMVQNAERYYEKSRSAKKSYEIAKVRAVSLKEKKVLLSQVIAEFDDISYLKELEKWLTKNEQLLAQFGLGSKGEGQAQVGYRTFEVDGYSIRVGKNAQGNDELLRISHKEDIWLHARGVSGSHVVIGMNRSQGFPAKSIIEKAASIAGIFSKMKGSSLVPVIFTKRKYVRKPKGAPAGAAKVDREEVILVEPGLPEEK